MTTKQLENRSARRPVVRSDDNPIDAQRTAPGTVEFDVDLRHSIWTLSDERWQDRAPDAYRHMVSGIDGGELEESGDRLLIRSSPTRASRRGTIELWFDGADLCLRGAIRFEASWNSLEDLCTSLDFDPGADGVMRKAQKALDLTQYGVTLEDGDPGVVYTASRRWRQDSKLQGVLRDINDLELDLMLINKRTWLHFARNLRILT